MRRFALLLFLVAAPSFSAPIVICDPATSRVVSVLASADTSLYLANTAANINPPALATLQGTVTVSHWMCVGTPGAWTNLREMTQPEKDALAAEQAAAATAAAAQTEADAKENACGSFSGQTTIALTLRGLSDVLLDEINILRDLYPMPLASITRSGTTATATTRWPHGRTGTFTVTIHGATLAAYNLVATATVTGASTFTYPGVAGNPTTPAAGVLTAYPTNAAPAPRTLAQAKTAICNAINNGEVDE